MGDEAEPTPGHDGDPPIRQNAQIPVSRMSDAGPKKARKFALFVPRMRRTTDDQSLHAIDVVDTGHAPAMGNASRQDDRFEGVPEREEDEQDARDREQPDHLMVTRYLEANTARS